MAFVYAKNMISQLGLRISAGFRKVAPDPFILAILLTFVTIILVLMATDTSLAGAVDIWAGSDGIWSAGLLKFAMQMCLILVTGHALASSPPVSRMLDWLATRPRTAGQAVCLVACVAATLAVLNWGLGLIAGALIARRVGVSMEQKGIKTHYPLLAAAGYVGLMVWHGGFSGSAPLKVSSPSEIIDIFGPEPPFEAISILDTILSPMNLVITGGLLLIAPILFMLMSPRNERDIAQASSFGVTTVGRSIEPPEPDKPILPRILEDTPLVTVLFVLLIGWWAIRYYLPADLSQSGITRLTPDTVNMTMLMLGLILHGTPRRYVAAIEEAVRGCAGIILQFPLYAGIMGLMAKSGLTEQMATAIASTTNETTLPILTFFSAGIVNLFVPSGGGQWAVQGPIAMQAAVDTGVAPAKMVMAVAYGDQITNMLQPFWALPLLAITGVKARDIVGYTAIVMVVAAVWIVLGLLIF